MFFLRPKQSQHSQLKKASPKQIEAYNMVTLALRRSMVKKFAPLLCVLHHGVAKNHLNLTLCSKFIWLHFENES